MSSNHRGETSRPLSCAACSTRGGATTCTSSACRGSDLPAPVARDRAINARLDRVLGVGTDLATWLSHVKRGLRVSPHGHTVLVDYGDEARDLPNLWATGLGHAAYTRRDAMLFHATLLADRFYPPPAPWTSTRWTDRMRWLPGVRGRRDARLE